MKFQSRLNAPEIKWVIGLIGLGAICTICSIYIAYAPIDTYTRGDIDWGVVLVINSYAQAEINNSFFAWYGGMLLLLYVAWKATQQIKKSLYRTWSRLWLIAIFLTPSIFIDSPIPHWEAYVAPQSLEDLEIKISFLPAIICAIRYLIDTQSVIFPVIHPIALILLVGSLLSFIVFVSQILIYRAKE